MKRKFLSLILVFAMTVSLLTVGTGAVEPTYGDTAGHWAESSIERWSSYGIIQGSNGEFDPNGQLTCAQLATILAKLLKLPAAPSAGFSDVAADAWYADAINRCVAAGILNGNGDGTVSPTAPITRERAMVMLGRALGIKPIENPDLSKYGDAAKVSAYAQGYVAAMIEAGIVTGVGNNQIAPQDDINRASTVTILDRAIAIYADKDGATIDAKDGGLILIVAKNVKIVNAPEGTIIVIANGATGLNVNDKSVTDGQTYVVPKTEPAKPSSGSSSGGSSTPSHTHVWATEWDYNETHHWHNCTAANCTVSNAADKNGYAEHTTFTYVNNGDGTHTKTCSDCGRVMGTEDHTFGEWEPETDATCTTDGSKKRSCTFCDYEATETIPATGHDFVDGVCSVCGVVNPTDAEASINGNYYRTLSDALNIYANDNDTVVLNKSFTVSKSIQLPNKNITINFGTYTITGDADVYVLRADTTGANVTLTGTTGGIRVNGSDSGIVKIGDGVTATVSITGGTFSSDPSKYVANGYTAVNDGSAATWTVMRSDGSEEYPWVVQPTVDSTKNRIVFEAKAAPKSETVAYVTGNVNTNKTTINNINDNSVLGIKVNVPAGVNILVFKDMTFSGAIRGFTTNRLNDSSQWDGKILTTVRFENCTFTGALYGNLADLALNVEFKDCKFTNSEGIKTSKGGGVYSLYISHATKWHDVTSAGTAAGVTNPAGLQRGLTFTACEFTGTRGALVTNPDGLNVKFDKNTFNLSGDDGTRNICLEGGSDSAKSKFGDVEIYNNTITIIDASTKGNALVTLKTKDAGNNETYTINLNDGKKVYCYENNIPTDAKLFCGDDGKSENLSTDSNKLVSGEKGTM